MNIKCGEWAKKSILEVFSELKDLFPVPIQIPNPHFFMENIGVFWRELIRIFFRFFLFFKRNSLLKLNFFLVFIWTLPLFPLAKTNSKAFLFPFSNLFVQANDLIAFFIIFDFRRIWFSPNDIHLLLSFFSIIYVVTSF